MLHEAQPGTATTLMVRVPGPLRQVHREAAMTTTLTDDPVLTRFRQALDEIYGGRIERVVLFGSRARGDAHAGSDYDVAVFLRDLTDRFPEMNRLADLSTEILDETGAFIHAMPYPAGSYNDRTPLMLGLRADGIDL
jgi:predicted nucleotidyltransferase